MQTLKLMVGFLGALLLASVLGPLQVHAQMPVYQGACVLISSDHTYESTDVIHLAGDEVLLTRVDHVETEWRERQFARGSQFSTLQPQDGFEAFASIWQCRTEQDIRGLVAWRLEQSALMFSAKPDAFMANGGYVSRIYQSACPTPLPNGEPKAGWSTLNGSAMVYDRETGKYTIVDGQGQVRNRTPYVVQSTSVCSNDELLQNFVVNLRSQGTYVMPYELVDVIRIPRLMPVLDEVGNSLR